MRRDSLEQGALEALLPRHDEVGRVTGQRAAASRPPRRVLCGAAEPADQLTGQVLECGERSRAAVEHGRPVTGREQAGKHLLQLRLGGRFLGVGVGGRGELRERELFCLVCELLGGDMTCLQAILEIVDRVGDVVGPVHDLRFQARPHAAAHRP